MGFLSNLRVFDTLLFFSQKDVCQEIFINRLSGHVSFRAIGENLSVSSSKNTELGIKKKYTFADFTWRFFWCLHLREKLKNFFTAFNIS